MASLPVPDLHGFEEAPEQQGMDDNELVSLLQAHEAAAVGYFADEIASEQAKALEYYYGRMDDVPVLEGCSAVTDNTVAVMVENGLAAVLKPFVSSDETVSFNPRGPEDTDAAEQATEYVNYVINCDNPGFLIFHNWFKDAMLTKLGTVKTWWEDRTEQKPRAEVVDAAGLMKARKQDTYQGENDNGDGTFTVNHLDTFPDGRVCIENVPPEELLIPPYTRDIGKTSYIAHRPSNYTRSDLLEMGVDAEVVESLPAYADGRNEESRRLARYRDENSGSSERMGNLSDPSRDIIGVIDEYVRCDYNGDGLAELRRVVRVNDVILLNEEIDDHPFATLCPVPMPHKVYGLSTADQSMQGQKIATALWRQTLDNLYKSNNPRPEVAEALASDTTFEDLQDASPGAIVRTKNPGAINWVETPFTAQHSIPMLAFNQQQTEERTGVQFKGNGFNADALRKNSPDTATAAAIDENSRNERAEMVARIFAETGVTRLFKIILRLLVDHQPKERMVRLRNKWVPMDPRGWSPDMDMTISVGLGMGNKAEQIMHADSVLRTMVELQDTPYDYLIDAEKVFNALKRKFTAAGIKNIDDFLVDPKHSQPPPPQPSPEMAKVQSEAQLQQQRMQFDQQATAAKLQGEQQIAAFKFQAQQQADQAGIDAMREKAMAEQQLARDKATFEAQLAEEKMNREWALEIERMNREHALNQQRAEHDATMQQNRPGGDLDK